MIIICLWLCECRVCLSVRPLWSCWKKPAWPALLWGSSIIFCPPSPRTYWHLGSLRYIVKKAEKTGDGKINKIILYSYCFFSSYFRSLSSIFNMLPTVKQDLSLYIFFPVALQSSLKSKIRASWISSRLWTKREPWKSPPLPSGRL